MPNMLVKGNLLQKLSFRHTDRQTDRHTYTTNRLLYLNH